MPVMPKIQAHSDPGEGYDKKQERRPGSLPASKQRNQKTFVRLYGHKRFKQSVHQESAQEIPDWYGEKLQGITDGIHPSLHLLRYMQKFGVPIRDIITEKWTAHWNPFLQIVSR